MHSHIKDWFSNITANDSMLACDLFPPVHFQGKPYNITVIQVYAPTTNAKEAEVEPFYEDLQDLLELTPKKDFLFITSTGMQKEEIKRYLE